MTLLFYITCVVLLCLLMVKATTWLIKSSARLARFYNISEYTISFLVIAFATSLPELLVGVISALDKNPSLSYGNVLGSNIADLTIILAIPLLVGGSISTKEIIKNKDLLYTVFFGVFPFVLLRDGLLSRLDALVLLVAYLFYLTLVLRRNTILEVLVNNLHNTKVYKEFCIFFMSVLVLLMSASGLVKVAENIGVLLNMPLIFIGITVTALGTSLPELVFGLKAIKTNHKGEVLGNIV
ncbi:sodium:calcium antiporter, partial [Patescibacteria group bacterium]|nr:sodium:calcium antiporter [Patescibacteria group bacterium]